MGPWDAAGGGGGMVGGVDRGCVFTSAGESGIAAAFFSLLGSGVLRKEAARCGRPVAQVVSQNSVPPP